MLPMLLEEPKLPKIGIGDHLEIRRQSHGQVAGMEVFESIDPLTFDTFEFHAAPLYLAETDAASLLPAIPQLALTSSPP
jgi:uncharacterized protein YuzE